MLSHRARPSEHHAYHRMSGEVFVERLELDARVRPHIQGEADPDPSRGVADRHPRGIEVGLVYADAVYDAFGEALDPPTHDLHGEVNREIEQLLDSIPGGRSVRHRAASSGGLRRLIGLIQALVNRSDPAIAYRLTVDPRDRENLAGG